MTSKIYISLDSTERDALVALSRSTRRNPRDQGAVFIRERLEALGFLQPTQTKTSHTTLELGGTGVVSEANSKPLEGLNSGESITPTG